jgi:integrase
VSTELARGEWLDPVLGRLAVRDWLVEWQRSRLVQPSTAAEDAAVMRRYVLPVFGDRPIASVTPMAVREWVGELSRRGLAGSTVRRAYRVMASAMAAAAEAGMIRLSPCRGVRLPSSQPDERAFLTLDQVALLLEHIPEQHYALVWTAYFTGLRWQELAALRLRRLDLLRRRLEVAEATKEINGRVTFGPPKSRTSRRVVTLEPETVEVLARHLELWPADGPDGLVFTAARGGPLSRNLFGKRVWTPALHAAGLDALRPRPTFHSLRHSHVAALIAEGTPMKAVQARLGHASMRITYDTYGHLEEQLDAQLLASLAARARVLRANVPS